MNCPKEIRAAPRALSNACADVGFSAGYTRFFSPGDVSQGLYVVSGITVTGTCSRRAVISGNVSEINISTMGQLQGTLTFGCQGCQVTMTGTAPCTFQGVTSQAPFAVGGYLRSGRVAFS